VPGLPIQPEWGWGRWSGVVGTRGTRSQQRVGEQKEIGSLAVMGKIGMSWVGRGLSSLEWERQVLGEPEQGGLLLVDF
jgi:hypothetical protein